METMLMLLVAVVLIAVFEASAVRFGADSREHPLDDYRRPHDDYRRTLNLGAR